MNIVPKENVFPVQLVYHYYSVINWLVHISLLGLLSALFYGKFNGGLKTTLFVSALLLKLLAGLLLGWIFHDYYGAGDTLLFFEKSKQLAALSKNEYLKVIFSSSSYEVSDQPRVLFFTKFLSFLILITKGSYWISSLYVSLISFFGAWYLVTVIKEYYNTVLTCAIICFLFVPSIVFWSSGILKDTLAFAATTILVGITLTSYKRKSISLVEIIVGLFGCFILFKIKHYLLISFLIFGGLLAFLSFIGKSSFKYRLIAIGIIIGVAFTSQVIHPYLKLNRIAITIFENNQAIRGKTESKNQVSIKISSPELHSILKEVPKAVQIGLFRPGIYDPTPIWGWVHRIENTLLAILFCLSILLYFKVKPIIDWPLIIASLATILLLAIMLSLSTPNFGTLVRYKNAFLPFFVLGCLTLPYQYFIDKKWD